MADPLQSTHEIRMMSLVSGIMHDVRDLLQQQMRLFKLEFENSLRKIEEAFRSLHLGRELGIAGGLSLVFMAVHLLHEVVPALPLSACYGMVGLPLLVAGGALLHRGRKKLKSVSLLPEQSLEALEESVAWIMKRK